MAHFLHVPLLNIYYLFLVWFLLCGHTYIILTICFTWNVSSNLWHVFCNRTKKYSLCFFNTKIIA